MVQETAEAPAQVSLSNGDVITEYAVGQLEALFGLAPVEAIRVAPPSVRSLEELFRELHSMGPEGRERRRQELAAQAELNARADEEAKRQAKLNEEPTQAAEEVESPTPEGPGPAGAADANGNVYIDSTTTAAPAAQPEAATPKRPPKR